MKPKEILRQARTIRGMSANDVAIAAGISLPSYCDLEDHDDEIIMSISMGELCKVCDAIGITIGHLFGKNANKAVDFASLADSLQVYIENAGISLHQFEERAGWDLRSFLQSPTNALEWNLECLQDVCRELGLNWIDYLPNCSMRKS